MSSSTVDPSDPVFALHLGGKMAVTSTVPLSSREDLSLAYTPGVAQVCAAIGPFLLPPSGFDTCRYDFWP